MQPLFSICFLDHICNTTSKSCRNINFRISNKPNNNLTLWPKLIFQICTKLLSACFSSSTSTTVALQQVLSCYLHTPGSHQSSLLNRSESVSQSVREQVSDKGKQWLDSGPIKKSWAHLIKNRNDMFGNWSISTRDLLSSKLWISKKYTLFHFRTIRTTLRI